MSRKVMPLMVGNTFVSPFNHKMASLIDLFKFLVGSKDNSGVPSAEELDKTLPISTPVWGDATYKGLRATWLGHACVYVEIDGLAVMTDPVFSLRCSPVQWAGAKRYRNAPCTVDDIPRLDICFISHDHYDHLDRTTVEKLARRFPKMMWYVPTGTKAWFDSIGIKTNVRDVMWWEEAPHDERSRVVAFPSNHWCKRSLLDTNTRLWCSWGLITPKYRFFFAGDTASCEAFTDVGNLYGPFDLAAIPIGAYEPRWFMKYHHVNPEEAVQLHQQIKAKRTIGVHWGTFKLTTEPYLEPPELLGKELDKAQIDREHFFIVGHGESRVVDAEDRPATEAAKLSSV